MDSFETIADRIAARVTGPMSFRFLVQPLVAILLGIRDGRLDARAGAPPFVWGLVFNRGDRRAAFRSAVKTVLKPVILGIVFDAIAQYLIFHAIRPGGALAAGILLLALPYAAARAWSNRIITRLARRRAGAARAGAPPRAPLAGDRPPATDRSRRRA